VNPYFRFNWHIKTRTPQELHKRVELLAKQFEKDYDREKEKMKQAKKKKNDLEKKTRKNLCKHTSGATRMRALK